MSPKHYRCQRLNCQFFAFHDEFDVFKEIVDGYDRCVECFECEEKCPQGIPIAQRLKQAQALLGETREG